VGVDEYARTRRERPNRLSEWYTILKLNTHQSRAGESPRDWRTVDDKDYLCAMFHELLHVAEIDLKEPDADGTLLPWDALIAQNMFVRFDDQATLSGGPIWQRIRAARLAGGECADPALPGTTATSTGVGQ